MIKICVKMFVLGLVLDLATGMTANMGSILVMNVPEKRGESPFLIIRPVDKKENEDKEDTKNDVLISTEENIKDEVEESQGQEASLEEKEERVRVRRTWRRRRRRLPNRDKATSMQRLLAIANNEVDTGSVNNGEMSIKRFVCPVSDGLFADPQDCSKYVRCAHGKPSSEKCSNGLVWNRRLSLCDWPRVTRCAASAPPAAPPAARKARSHLGSKSNIVVKPNFASPPLVLHPNLMKEGMQLVKSSSLPKSLPQSSFLPKSSSHSKTIYLTFDDGPNSGTPNVLKALNTLGIKATFFVNAYHLFSGNDLVDQRNREALNLIASSGHALGDHSWDHMYHNSQKSPINAYRDLVADLAFFGRPNIQPILEILQDSAQEPRVNASMRKISRLPYSNHWRVTSANNAILRWQDCDFCTQPANSQLVASKLADALHHNGVNVYGWDEEWRIDWTNVTISDDAHHVIRNVEKMNSNKVVLLLHDLAFRTEEAVQQLKSFVQFAWKRGYTFRTLHHYVQS